MTAATAPTTSGAEAPAASLQDASSSTPSTTSADTSNTGVVGGGALGAISPELLAALEQALQSLQVLVDQLRGSTSGGGAVLQPGQEAMQQAHTMAEGCTMQHGIVDGGGAASADPTQGDGYPIQGPPQKGHHGYRHPGQVGQVGPVGQVGQYGRYNPNNVHLTQFKSSFNPDGKSRSKDCVPTSAVMALRLAGLDVPGQVGSDAKAISVMRKLGSGNTRNEGMNLKELQKMLRRAGAESTTSTSAKQVMKWAREGTPVVIFGNSDAAWGRDRSDIQYSKYDGDHAATLSGYEPETGMYLVNDPLSRTGLIRVSARDITDFLRGHSSGGSGTRVMNPVG